MSCVHKEQLATIMNDSVVNILQLYICDRIWENMHSSHIAHLEIRKNHREWYLDVKLSGMIKE